MLLKSKLCVVSASPWETARSKWLACIQETSQTIDMPLITWRQCLLKNLRSRSSPVYCIRLTKIVATHSALLLTHGGGARGHLTTLCLTSKMQSKSSVRKNIKAVQWRWPCPPVCNPSSSIARGVTSHEITAAAARE